MSATARQTPKPLPEPPAGTEPCATAFVALGSNLGDRRAALEFAIDRLDAIPGVRVIARSSLHKTEPVGGPPGQSPYLNAVVRIQSSIGPDALFAAMLAIEAEHGRTRDVPNGPRTLDLDLLLYGDLRRDDAELTLPHPRMWRRAFVLDPLAEVCDLPALRRQWSATMEESQ